MELSSGTAAVTRASLDAQPSLELQQQAEFGEHKEVVRKDARAGSPNDATTNAQSCEQTQQQEQQQQKQQQQHHQQQQQQKTKRKHRRGKPKSKNSNKLYKKTNWKFQIPRINYNYKGGNGCNNGNGSNRSRAKLARSRSLVPYNTNKFLMEEHLAEVPSALLTPSGRTRDSSFSVDSDDNYFYSLPEDEEEFLTKEFDNIYEKARVERLENLTKQQLIEECMQIEDRYSSDQGTQRQQQLNVQRISSEFAVKIRILEDKVRELTRENFDLRSQLMRSAALAAAAAASPPSANAPIGSACQPTPMDSASEDSESDSTSTSSSSASSSPLRDGRNGIDEYPNEAIDHNQQQNPNRIGTVESGSAIQRVENSGLQHFDESLNDLCSASSSRSSLSDYNEASLGSNLVGIPQQIDQQDMLVARMEEDEQSSHSNELRIRNSCIQGVHQIDDEQLTAANLPSTETRRQAFQ